MQLRATTTAAAWAHSPRERDLSVSWRAIYGFEGYYEVSSKGDVRSLDRFFTRANNGVMTKFHNRGKLLRPTVRGDGRRRFQLCVDLVKSQHYAAALVLAAFVCPRPDGMEACHFDGNPGNDSLANLRWGTPAENSADKRRHGTCFGNHNKWLPAETVLQIKELRSAGVSQPKIAEATGVNESTINKIINGKRRARVSRQVAA